MSRPANARYSESHEWAILDGDTLTMGVTDFAVEALGDIVFVDLPDVGTELAKGDTACEIVSDSSRRASSRRRTASPWRSHSAPTP